MSEGVQTWENLVQRYARARQTLDEANAAYEAELSRYDEADYPALVGACALGERILNHLILDLRGAYAHTPEYKRVHRKDSFDDWRVPIDTLAAWTPRALRA